MNTLKNVSERLIALREEQGETQQQLADAIGITRQTLSRYEIGMRTMGVDILAELAKHFGVSADFLLGLSDVKSTDKDIQTACAVTGLSEEAIKQLDLVCFSKEYEHIRPAIDALCQVSQTYGDIITNPSQFYSALSEIIAGSVFAVDGKKNTAKICSNDLTGSELLQIDVQISKLRTLLNKCIWELQDSTRQLSFVISDPEACSKMKHWTDAITQSASLKALQELSAEELANRIVKAIFEESEQEAPEHGEHHTQT